MINNNIDIDNDKWTTAWLEYRRKDGCFNI